MSTEGRRRETKSRGGSISLYRSRRGIEYSQIKEDEKGRRGAEAEGEGEG